MATGTVRLHRMLNAKPERAYKAFLDADAMNKWLPPNSGSKSLVQLARPDGP